MLSPVPTGAPALGVRLPCSAADENNVPLLRQLTFLRGHRSITRPVEQSLEQVLRHAGYYSRTG